MTVLTNVREEDLEEIWELVRLDRRAFLLVDEFFKLDGWRLEVEPRAGDRTTVALCRIDVAEHRFERFGRGVTAGAAAHDALTRWLALFPERTDPR